MCVVCVRLCVAVFRQLARFAQILVANASPPVTIVWQLCVDVCVNRLRAREKQAKQHCGQAAGSQQLTD